MEQQNFQTFLFDQLRSRFDSTTNKIANINVTDIFTTVNIKDNKVTVLKREVYEAMGIYGFAISLHKLNNLKSVLTKKQSDIIIDNLSKNFKFTELEIRPVFNKLSRIECIFNELRLPDNFSKLEDLLNNSKEYYADQLSEKVVTDDSYNFTMIKSYMNKVLKSQLVTVSNAIAVEKLLTNISLNQLTYQDLLNFNTIFYSDGVIKIQGCYDVMDKLLKNTLYIKLLEKVSKYNDNIKFALMYFDSICSIFEQIEKNIDPNVVIPTDNYGNVSPDYYKGLNYMDCFNNLSFIDEVEDETVKPNNPIVSEKTFDEDQVKQQIESVESIDEENNDDNIEENPGLFVRELLLEFSTDGTLIDGFNKLVENEEYFSRLYQFISSVKLTDNTSFGTQEEIAEFISAIQTEIPSFEESYKNYVNDICSPIEDEKLISLINELIRHLIVFDSKAKTYIISQLYENCIETSKNLNEILTCIDDCYIETNKTSLRLVSELHNYVELRGYKNKFNKYNNLQIEQIRVQMISRLIKWLDFYKVKETK